MLRRTQPRIDWVLSHQPLVLFYRGIWAAVLAVHTISGEEIEKLFKKNF
jgi:hypothetical protein